MGTALVIRDDLSAEELRCQARREPNRRSALRMLAIAGALEGLSRAEAARLVGMERQALRWSATTPRGLLGYTTDQSRNG